MSSRFIAPFYDVGSGIKPSSGSKLFFFETDGVTPKDTFSDQLSTPTANTNPVVSDSNGVFSDIYISGIYKVTLEDKNGSQIFGGAIVQASGASGENIGVITLAEAVANTSAEVGQIVQITDRDDAQFTYLEGQSPNGNGIILCTGIPTLSLVIRDSDVNTEESITDAIQTTNGFTDIDPAYIAELKALGDITSDTDSVTIKKKSIKAWKKPTGIKDSAVAGSFMLNNGVNEPQTQVSGFPDIDSIGIQQSRDAVAVFAQVDATTPLLETSNVTYTATTIVSPDFAAIWDEIEVGLICDVNFGTVGWVGAVITSKTGNDTLNIQSWREIDGVSGPASTPTNGDPLTIDRHNAIWGGNFNAIIPSVAGANQAIGLEVGVQCVKAGTGANSKGFLAVAFPGGERPEFGYSLTGLFGKGYTSQDCNIYGFGSIGDKVGLDVMGSTENAIQTEDPAGHHIECRDSASASQFIVTKEGLVGLGKNVESGNARLNIRGDGLYTADYDETEIAIFDPTTALVSGEGFYITQEYLASSSGGSFNIGVKSTSNHVYQLYIQTEGVNRMQFHSNGHIYAGVDNTQSMGTAGKRWSEIFAANGTINTSDEREKTPLTDFTDAESRVAVKLKQLIKTYKWKESVEREMVGGKKARIHVGIGAQSLGQAFTDEGLDPDDYAMFCYDEWGAEENLEAGDRYGVRLDQVMAFIIANT